MPDTMPHDRPPHAEDPLADDGALVRQALTGRPASFGALYDRHVDRVYRFCRFRVHDSPLALDLTQDVFESALRHLPALRDPERFVSWLMRIAHHRVLDQWHLDGRVPPITSWERAQVPAEDDAGPAELTASDDVMAQVLGRLDVETLLTETERLTEDQQAVLGLRFAGGLNVAEAATVLERSEDAVKQLQRRALSQLRRRLAERGLDP
jgi:RNA polymerase sigma-70 factor (ECF subfamily)